MTLTSAQQTFARVFAQQTGLDPYVVEAWVGHEQGTASSQAYYQQGSFYGGKAYNNWLNVGVTQASDLDTGANGTHSTVWDNPTSAAMATAEWAKGKGPITTAFGKAAASIRSILTTAGKPPQQQLHAIASSGWAQSGYPGLQTYYNQVLKATTRRSPSVPPRPVATPAAVPPSTVKSNLAEAARRGV